MTTYYIETHSKFVNKTTIEDRHYRKVEMLEFYKCMHDHEDMYNEIVDTDYNDSSDDRHYLKRSTLFYARKCIISGDKYSDDTFEFMSEDSNDWCNQENWMKLMEIAMAKQMEGIAKLFNKKA